MMMFEHYGDPLVPRRTFVRRAARFAGLAALLVGGALLIGILGYHYIEGMAWIDSLLNASMILGGMGPVDKLTTTGGKLFASFYALFAGIVFLVSVGVLIAPIVHRLLHRFHLETAKQANDDDDDEGDKDADENPHR